jgi:hypothetical protein
MIDRFSRLLLAEEVVDRSQLDLLRHRARLLGGGLDQHLLETGTLDLEGVIRIYASSIELPHARGLDLDRIERRRSAAFPAQLRQRWRFIPVRQQGLVWQVLSDSRPDADRRAAIRSVLGVDILVRAVPPFLYDILAAWLRGIPPSEGLALLAANLFPRFVVAAESVAEVAVAALAPQADQPSGLPARLALCSGGTEVLSGAAQYLGERFAYQGVWRVDGSVLYNPQGSQEARLINGFIGLAEALASRQAVITRTPVPSGWADLLAAPEQLRSVAVRPIIVVGRCLALLAIGAQFVAIDAASSAELDRVGASVEAGMKQRLSAALG